MRLISSRSRIGVVSLSLVISALATAALAAHHAGAQSDVHVVWPSATTKLTFLDFGHDGLLLGDRLASRGPLVDETQTTQVGYATWSASSCGGSPTPRAACIAAATC